jgi:murein DD-endopeptidase MepM/ murein hydrolase activator NlpD
MVNYTKKKPTFKSKAEMYKKSKWVKFKEKLLLFFNMTQREFAKIAYKIKEKGSQRLTIMIVPHSEKRIINIQISNYIIYFTIVVLIATVITSIFSVTNSQQIGSQVSWLRDKDQLSRIQIDNYNRGIEGFNKRFTMFKMDINNIMKSTGKEKNIYNVEKIDTGEDATNSHKPQGVIKLDNMKEDLEASKEELQYLANFIGLYKQLLKDMPSSYPLVNRAAITSPYGWRPNPFDREKPNFHPGLDLGGEPGSPVLAAGDGVVAIAGYTEGYGNLVEIKHKYGISTFYGHMERFGPFIYVGSIVKQGQTIGYVGSTGLSTGPHLHFEIRIGDNTTSPVEFTTMQP